MKTSRAIKCWRYSVFFYIILYCVSGVSLGLFIGFFLLVRHDINHILGSKRDVFYFLFIPSILTIITTTIGWKSIKRKNFKLIKCFAVMVALTVVLEVAGSLWCFFSYQKVYDQALLKIEEKFSYKKPDIVNESWWNNIQKKFKCCGLHGPADYHATHAVPFSCCGFHPDNNTRGSCSLIWQEGCSNVLATEISQDFILVSVAAATIAFIQIPGVFVSWCFSNRISREGI